MKAQASGGKSPAWVTDHSSTSAHSSSTGPSRNARSRAESGGWVLETARRPPHPYPPPAQILGLLFDSIFLDALDYDAHLLERINRLLPRIPPAERLGLRPIELFVLRPSRDLPALASQREPQLPPAFRFLMRGLGTREAESPGALSMLMFEPTYLAEVIRIGEADAEKHLDQLAALLE